MGLLDLDGDTGNFLSQLLTSTGSMTPGFMQPQQRPSYNNVLNSAAQTAVDPIFGPGYRGMQPGTGTGPSYEDIQRQAYQGAGAPTGGEAPRRRSSVVDILGTFADAFAELGGEKGSYQSRLDAQRERERQAEADQMEREAFGLKKQQFGLETRKAENDILNDQNEVLGRASAVLRHGLSTGGPERAAALWTNIRGRLGMTPEQMAQADAEFRANPEGFIEAMSAFAESGKNAKFGTTPRVIVNPQTGETRWVQVSEAGGIEPIELPEGFVPDPRIQFLDDGYGFTPASRNTGTPNGPRVNKTGDETKGTQFVQNPDGTTSIAPVEGGEMNNELTEEVRNLQTLGNALDSFESIFPEVRNNIDAMAAAGSLSGVPDGTTYAADPSRPLTGGSNIGAIAMQNVPLLEQAVNDQGFSARQQIESAGRTMVQQLGPLLTQAQNSGANLTSRMMDTPKELEGLLAQAINTKDYRAAVKAYDRFKARYDEVRREVQEKARAAQARTAQGRKQSQPSAPSGGNRIRYDAQGNRIQ